MWSVIIWMALVHLSVWFPMNLSLEFTCDLEVRNVCYSLVSAPMSIAGLILNGDQYFLIKLMDGE